MTDPRWTLAIHGGAGQMTRDTVSPATDAGTRAGLAAALDAGTAILADGGSAVDAVEAAVRVLEDDPHFNAGRGAALTYDGIAELDAAIMDGATRAAGAVAAVHATRNPVALARAVMTDSPHVFLAGAGADAFCDRTGHRTGRSRLVRHRRAPRQPRRAQGRRGRCVRRRHEIRHRRRGRLRRPRPCRRRDLDRRGDGQALGPDRRFARHRRGHLCRRSRRRGVVHRGGRILPARRRRARRSLRASGCSANRSPPPPPR